jgi:exodeoxyribonuclease VII large subunit
MSQAVWSVSSLLQFIKLKLDNDAALTSVWLKGEVSNFTAHRSGHWYFTIKDESARISCVMFANQAAKVVFLPKDGDQVLLKAGVSLYAAQGQMQLYVTLMQNQGIGDLFQKFEALKKKLHAEGLFDEARKKPLPNYPMKIGVISGKETAALQDILSTLKKRWPLADINLYYSLVQGSMATDQIIQRLKQADADANEVIILARGGGSIEDLWPFNEERVARCIASLKTPLIAGIGHETDITIADLVSDHRAPTPTGAAQAAVRDRTEIGNELSQLKIRAYNAMLKLSEKQALQFKALADYPTWQNADLLWQDAAVNLTMATQRLTVASAKITKQRERLQTLTAALIADGTQLQNNKREIWSKQREILFQQRNRLGEKERYKMARVLSVLNALSPLAVLERGYAIPFFEAKVLKSVDAVTIDDVIKLHLADGQLNARILEKEKNHE